MSSNGDQSVYAAAQARSYLEDDLQGVENERIREYAGLIDDPTLVRLLNYFCSLYAGTDESFLDTYLGQMLVRNAATETADQAFRAGNVSQLQGMVGLVNQAEDGEDALTRIAQRLASEGSIALLLGPPGSGKTATALDVSLIWRALTGGTVVSNITTWDRADEHVESSTELLGAMGDREGQVLAVLDEVGQELTSRGADSQASNRFAKELKMVRKSDPDAGGYARQGSVLLVGHTRRGTAAPLRRLASTIAEKPSQHDPGKLTLYDSDGGKDDLDEVASYQGITDSAETYREHEASSFVVDRSDDGDGEQEDGQDPLREQAVKTAIRHQLNNDARYADTAELVEYSDQWVGERWREWKAGEHRDLVEKPDLLPEHVPDEEVR